MLAAVLRRPTRTALLLTGALLALPGLAGAQGRAARERSLPVLGAVRIEGVDAKHPYTSRNALLTRSRSAAALASLDLPSLANASLTARNLLLAARGFMGTPYVWGGTSPGGFDCSGFTKYVFGLVGVSIPRNSREQLDAGTAIPAKVAALVPGDLMFFAASPSQPISHVAIYAGEGRVIHASGAGRAVRVDDLSVGHGRWLAAHMVAARRVLASESPAGASQ